MKRLFLMGPLALALMTAGCGSSAPRGLLGAYRFPDGTVVSIRPSRDNTLRFRWFENGDSGRLHPVSELSYVSGPGFSDQEPVAVSATFHLNGEGIARTLTWTPSGESAQSARHIGRDEWVTFHSGDTPLSGRLHWPDGEGPFPAVVLVHGSGKDSGSEWLYNGDFLAAHGFAVLAYDKRGTGQSAGEFTFDFHQLARDAAAGVEYLRTRSEIQQDRIGLSGYSQGGWVAPLAASLTPVRFVLVSYGMTESPEQEARLEMLALLKKGGVTGESLASADSLVTAAVAVVASEFRDGWDEFNELKREHKGAAWRSLLQGTPVDQLLKYPRWLVKLIGRGKLPPQLPWSYDSSALLDSLGVPMTWFLGEDDDSAPNERTISRLRAWKASGLPYELILYPETDHAMLVFREEDGRRVYTGYAPGYHRAEVAEALRWTEDGGK